MKITQLTVTNFRLLENITINIEDDITLIVGKNNTGKTSLFEVINLFFDIKNRISFHDFSLNSHDVFKLCDAKFQNELLVEIKDDKKDEIEKSLINDIPKITLSIQVEYDKVKDSLINISDFISDLDDTKSDATILFKYEPKETINLFRSFHNRPNKDVELIEWLNENISSFYTLHVFGGENLIEDHVLTKILSVINFETIQASRKLDDTKMDKNRSLALGFSDYYQNIHGDNNADVESLKDTLKSVSTVLDGKYEKVLEKILEKLKSFGIDKDINIPEIILKSKFDPESIIRNNIKYYYKSGDIELPENYNGLGYSNLIFLVLKIVAFIENFKKNKEKNATEILTILIEEPEAHLHPQMQQVFVEQIRETISKALIEDSIQVQLIISTHSSHMIAEAGLNVKRSFERIRYFNKYKKEDRTIVEVKDFNEFKHKETDKDTFRFLKQYLNLHKCDLFFADKVIMVEGITEKILMPLFIRKVAKQLENEYVSIIEVGGAYTHKFKEFFKFLNTKVLVITDIDSVDAMTNKSCHVLKEMANTSNSTLSTWLPQKTKISELLALTFDEKLDESKIIRVAFQIKEDDGDFVPRSLENAIINCNQTFFKSKYLLEGEIEKEVYKSFSFQKLKNIDELIYMDTSRDQSDVDPSSKQKTDFTFDLMTFDEKGTNLEWKVPKYIKEGLEWLSKNEHLLTVKVD
ncbi:ATP-dependent nuclease [Flavobacterium sp. I3-2]|uniref:ATP-dependent nuclease n=1 Tax=Flavobacterium sp. I3-2 TaxID=2748319 RepID=UPI0015AA0F27|nr:AAA family ATPase [Flavobacterium sp. I3-2]